MFWSSPLTWILLVPAIGGVVTYAVPQKASRWIALIASALTLIVSLVPFFIIVNEHGMTGFGNIQQLPMSVNLPWVSFTAGSMHFQVRYFLGIDGLSLSMVVLNAFLTMLTIISGWNKPRVKDYMAILLLLEAGVMGVFMAMDLFLFFLFWEVELAPTFLLIGIWGSERVRRGVPGRVYSAWKFLLYSFFGSIFMLIGILVLYFTNVAHGGTPTASMVYFAQHIQSYQLPLFGWMIGSQLLIFLLIFVAFAIKIPMFPFHSWLPDVYTDAPTETSVMLSGVLSKMGAYGLIRICLGLFPQGVNQFSGALMAFAVINIIYGALICLAQKNMKRTVAYSSFSHMGIILLGVAAAAGASNGIFTGQSAEAFRQAALVGAIFQMFAHGIITGLLFFCEGVIYDRAQTRDVTAFGGVAKRMPFLAALFLLGSMASLGLPGLAGFVSEYIVFTASFRIWTVVTIISAFTMILTAAYLLWIVKRVFFGTFNSKWDKLADVNLREAIPLMALAAVIVIVGVYPTPIIHVIQPCVTQIMHTASIAVALNK
ncbi:MAG TPA: NADH-quinone oxidoreductase subunit M [Dictyobacter sp.]|jgi:NADH-quinone oxidoreductase subunit M|nr:NADH-quinone oxidoreductase subunit M [Dictyobacter sp.]